MKSGSSFSFYRPQKILKQLSKANLNSTNKKQPKFSSSVLGHYKDTEEDLLSTTENVQVFIRLRPFLDKVSIKH